MKPIFSALFVALLAASSATHVRAQALQTSTIDTIAAVVNEDVILRSEVDLAVANISRQLQSQNPGQLPPRDVLERQVLERLILMRLQVERAESSGIRISDQELQQAIGTVASQNKMTVDELRQRLAADGLDYN
jgi:peptidyl-prolyl cis-trans isomerase SurA